MLNENFNLFEFLNAVNNDSPFSNYERMDNDFKLMVGQLIEQGYVCLVTYPVPEEFDDMFNENDYHWMKITEFGLNYLKENTNA